MDQPWMCHGNQTKRELRPASVPPGAGKVAEIRGHQHHDVFHGTLDASRVISYLGLAHTGANTSDAERRCA
jgi:hypothetical protein